MPCAACQKFVYDLETGAVQTYTVGREKLPQPRPPGTLTPCKLGVPCPKVSPEREHEFVLCERNRLMLEYYRTSRATFGKSLAQPDALTCLAFRILDDLFKQREQFESHQQLVQLATAMRR